MSNKYEPGVWYEWSGGENPVPGMPVEYRMNDAGEQARTDSSVLRWVHENKDTDIIAFRPAASSPSAVGVGSCTCHSHMDCALHYPATPTPAPSAVGVGVYDPTDPPACAPAIEGPQLPYAPTPTPSPVDWERVGPKLVEAVRSYLGAVDQSDAIGHAPADIMESALVNEEARLADLRAALAAAQPQSNGE